MREKKNVSLIRRRERCGYLFVLPFLIGFVFLSLDVLFNSVAFSFSNMTLTNDGYTLSFAGLEHYKYIFTVNPDFMPALTTSIFSFLLTVPVVIIFSLFVAVLLNQKTPGRTFFRAVFFIPVIIATGVVAASESGNVLAEGYQTMESLGASAASADTASIYTWLEGIFKAIGIQPDFLTYVKQLIDEIYSLVNRSGVQIILFLAALQSISPSIYEVASIEGATAWETFWKITIPMVSPVILVNLIYTAIDIFTDATNPIMVLINTVINGSNKYAEANAMAWSYFGIICIMLLILFALVRRYVMQQENE